MRGIPRSQLSSRSSNVKRRFWAFASLRFIEYSDQTRAESRNSASHGCKYLYKLGMSWSSSCVMPARKCVTFEISISNQKLVSLNSVTSYLQHQSALTSEGHSAG